MSELKFTCPDCGQHIAADARWSGLQVSCPTCRAPFIVPDESGAMACVGAYSGDSAGQPSTASCQPAAICTQPRRPVSKLAIACLVFCLSGILILPGLICGHLARSRIRRDPALRGNGIALTGLIVGYGGLVLAGVLLVAPVLLLFVRPPPHSLPPRAEAPALSPEANSLKGSPETASGGEPVRTEFLSLGGSPGWEIIKFRVTNLTPKSICELSCRYIYRDAQGHAIRISQMDKGIAPPIPGNATEELSGMGFPPQGTKAVEIKAMKVTFEDGTQWLRKE